MAGLLSLFLIVKNMPTFAIIQVDWPRCPSTNRLWRSRRTKSGKLSVYPNKSYTDWMRQAAGHWLLQRPKGFKTITGPYQTTIVIAKDYRRRDLGNYEKAISDAAQTLNIVANDKNCMRFLIEYGEAPMGMRVIFQSLST